MQHGAIVSYEGSEQSIYCTKVAPDHFDWPIFLFGDTLVAIFMYS